MRQTKDINQTRKNKHLNWEERIQREIRQRVGLSTAQVGMRIGRPARTIHREIRRGG
ncbi:helix-turn-helix domain-containing protein [Pontiella desulfatans]|uniref:helix-turn-helix domain-containing protein n=1 Tax=Pontiella desulfatans TaxID=2750659 RepID=UPI00109C400E